MLPENLTLIFNSDILGSDAQVIAQQCNCVSTVAKGLAEKIAQTFPHADFYSARDSPSTPGTIKIVGNKKRKERFVVAMFAQLNPGIQNNTDDTSTLREKWFTKCLHRISKIKNLKSIAFPYKIGCGLAGGKWDTYYDILNKWAVDNPNIKIEIISQEEDSSKHENLKGNIDENFEDSETADSEDSDDSSEQPDSPNSHNSLENDSSMITQRIQALTVSKKALLLDKLLASLSVDILISSSKLIEDIENKDEPPESENDPGDIEFYQWFWHQLEKHTPLLNLSHYISEYKAQQYPGNRDLTAKDDNHVDDSDASIDIRWGEISFAEFTRNYVPEEYEEFFDMVTENKVLSSLDTFLNEEIKKYTIYPPLDEIYTAFDFCPLSKMKVVIIGQDPYHTPGAAMGIAFGHHNDRGKIQPSLKNIYKALEYDGFSSNSNSGDLTTWCEQGVFLINTALTVRKGEAASHSQKTGPWGKFIKQLFEYISKKCNHLVVIAWGAKAQDYIEYFDSDKHSFITAPHPAASLYNSSNTEFFNHKPFSRANRFLSQWGMSKIDWNL